LHPALTICRELAAYYPSAYRPDVAKTLNNLGNLYRDTGRLAEADKAYSEALTIRRELATHDPSAYRPVVAYDPAAAQWQAQRAMMTQLATGGRLGIAIGVAGAGKSTALAPLVDAWKEEGRNVFGITLAWRQAGDLGAAGIEDARPWPPLSNVSKAGSTRSIATA
jgi:tetratricopeptide (TPR) repeat protein